MTYYSINGGWKSEDGRILIMRHYQEASYTKGGKKHYKKTKDIVYVVTVDGKELPFAEDRLKDAKEMALKQIKKNNQSKKAQTEVNSNGYGTSGCGESTSPSTEREGEGRSQEIISGSTATTLSEEWP